MNLKKFCCFILFGIKNKNIYNYDLTKLNIFNQIRGSYSIFNYNRNSDYFRYGSKNRSKHKRSNFKHRLVEDHHIIPKQFSKHKLIKDINFDVGCSNNLLIMPSRFTKSILNDNKIIYHHSHEKYNKYVGNELDHIKKNKSQNIDEEKYLFWLLFKDLEYRLCKNDESLPWN
tara:strand:- start:841 stop:1356 length:516 start_codon:yes stop_codon:yes gene_type:complete